MPTYDAEHYDPQAPIAEVSLRDPKSGAVVPDIRMLLDTGADITLLPRAAVERLNVAPIAELQFELLGFDGNKSMAQAVDVDMLFLRKAFRGRYLLVDDEHGVIGRDVLAAISLLFDGPNQGWFETTSTS